jgi:hypothetical protein
MAFFNALFWLQEGGQAELLRKSVRLSGEDGLVEPLVDVHGRLEGAT